MSEIRILMFASGFAPYCASENVVNSKLALAFQERGWEVEVISRPDPGFRYAETWEEPWLGLRPVTDEVEPPAGGRLMRAADAARSIARMGWPIDGVRWASRALDKALRRHAKRPCTVVLSRAPCEASHLPAMLFAAKTGVPWIANWNDPPAFLMPAPYSPGPPHKRAGLRRFSRRVLERASVSTFPCEALRRHVVGNLWPRRAVQTVVIPHIGLDRAPSAPYRRGERFVLCHAGNLSAERNPSVLFAALKRLIDSDSAAGRVRLEILGVSGHDLRPLIARHGLGDCVALREPLRYLDTLQALGRADVLVIVEAGCKHGIFLPSKLIDYVQCRRPVLALSPRMGTVAEILSRYGCGLAADCTSVDSAYGALRRLYRLWEAGELTSQFEFDGYWRTVYPDAVTSAYARVFDMVGARASELAVQSV